MSESLIQKCPMNDEGACRKVLSGNNNNDTIYRQEVLANSCASSRGKTGGAGSTRSYWA